MCKYLHDETTWNEAAHHCHSLGLQLAVFDNESINIIGEALYNIKKKHGQKAWLSGKAVNQKWKWVKFTKSK